MTSALTKPTSGLSLSGNQLKLIALVAMTCDHVGKTLLPQVIVLQIIGRLAFPLFAYMIAEGCRYTKNRVKYLGNIAALAVLCQLVYFVAMGSLYQSILVTFSLSIGTIYALDYARRRRTVVAWLIAGAVCLAVCFISVGLPILLGGKTDFAVDYGIWGILLPVGVFFAPTAWRIPVATALLIPLCLQYGGIQWWCLATLPLLVVYRGQRGRANLKNLFYIYYPAHLVVIYLLSLIF